MKSLSHGSLPEVISPHLLKLIAATGGADGPIGRQFIARPEKESLFEKEGLADPYLEDSYEVAPGLVYKFRGKLKKDGEIDYYGRALWTISRYCASYCRFCMRGREVGLPSYIKLKSDSALSQKSHLAEGDRELVYTFIQSHPELNEIILSGGDPFVNTREYLSSIVHRLSSLQQEGSLDIIRIGTRLPIHNPALFKDWHFELIEQIRNPYIMLHVNHPAELTEETLAVITRMRKAGATIMSQTVLLKGVNDSVETLQLLFNNLAREGIRPYYLFQNDPVYWARHFTVPFNEAVEIWNQLRKRLSGVAATAKFIIEPAGGLGKIPIPESGAWDFNPQKYKDFKDEEYKIRD